MTADFILRHAAELYTCAGPAPRVGGAMRDAGFLGDAALAARDGRILFVGPTDACDRLVRPASGAVILDASACAVLPGFVDPHTHAVYAGDRRHELQRRLAGATYEDVAAAGGGILATVAATRQATADALVDAALPRLREMLVAGTTTVEIKSGYGLTTADELKMLRAIRALGSRQPIEIAPTFMGAHELPPEYRGDRAGYVQLLITEMIPAVAAEGLAEWNDVFCERGVFTPDETQAILAAGREHGLKPRVHANELGDTGGAQAAAASGARSADHLVFLDAAAIASLRAAGVVATLLPIAAFYLKLGRMAPARALIDAGVAVALASDMNPGGGFSASMPSAMTLACFAMGMTLEEALIASTLNAAYALDRHDRVGSLEAGKQCDLVLVRGAAADLLRAGVSSVAVVVKNGSIVWRGHHETDGEGVH